MPSHQPSGEPEEVSRRKDTNDKPDCGCLRATGAPHLSLTGMYLPCNLCLSSASNTPTLAPAQPSPVVTLGEKPADCSP